MMSHHVRRYLEKVKSLEAAIDEYLACISYSGRKAQWLLTVILDPNSRQKLRVGVDKQFLYPNHSVDLGPIQFFSCLVSYLEQTTLVRYSDLLNFISFVLILCKSL
jgi:hypothetical protein